VEARAAAALVTTSPLDVNLTGLPARLTPTCRSRQGSPTTFAGTSGAIRHMSSRPFAWAAGATARAASVNAS